MRIGEPIMAYSQALKKDIIVGYRNEWDASGDKSRQQHQENECANPEIHDCPGCNHRPDCVHCHATGVWPR